MLGNLCLIGRRESIPIALPLLLDISLDSFYSRGDLKGVLATRWVGREAFLPQGDLSRFLAPGSNCSVGAFDCEN
jgi:hypothetical protein